MQQFFRSLLHVSVIQMYIFVYTCIGRTHKLDLIGSFDQRSTREKNGLGPRLVQSQLNGIAKLEQQLLLCMSLKRLEWPSKVDISRE